MSGERRVGTWLVGALGDIATTVVVGAGAIARGQSPPVGLITESAELSGLDLVKLDSIAFGGHDVREGSPVDAARSLARDGQLFPESLALAAKDDLEAFGRRIRPGFAFGCAQPVSDFESGAARERRTLGPRRAVEQIRADLRAFKEEAGLERVVVVHLASTEPSPPDLPELANEEGTRALVSQDDARLPASVLYALAAAEENAPFVNFTPCVGSSAPGLIATFERLRTCHAGRDGKTGETLLRSALAPMFLARNLRVLSWVGYNVLGNRDGAVLEDPGSNAAKTRGKEQVLTKILGDHLDQAATRIDYVKSLGDWKTSWDHVHFEGFLGMKGTLQLTWRASDSALAAPLVLDLVRLVELAQRRGHSGVLRGLSCFFKNPILVDEHSLHRQFDALVAFARELGAGAVHGGPRRTPPQRL